MILVDTDMLSAMAKVGRLPQRLTGQGPDAISAVHLRCHFCGLIRGQQNREMREFLAQVLERLGERISEEGEKTRAEIRKLQLSTG